MCRAIICTTCQRPGWAGCGAHVEQVLGHVPADERCRCADEVATSGATRRSGGLFGRFRRSLG
ncbi:MAG TPA: hypothetical protein VIS05_02855 [Ilumatobacter sp.]